MILSCNFDRSTKVISGALLQHAELYSEHLELSLFAQQTSPQEERYLTRQQFRKIKIPFFASLAKNDREGMLFLGFTPTDTTLLANHDEKNVSWREFQAMLQRVFCESSKLRYCDIDHMLPIAAGGGNEFSNLTIIPKTLHRLKCSFEQAQQPYMNGQDIILPIPKMREDGRPPNIPRLPDTLYRH